MFFVNEIEMYTFGISLSDPKIGYGPLEKQKNIFEAIDRLALQREQDKPLFSWWLAAGIILSEMVMLIDALACESAVRQNDTLWDEWNFTHTTGSFNGNPYNPFYGTGHEYTNYNDWLTDWNRRSNANHEQINAVCWGIHM